MKLASYLRATGQRDVIKTLESIGRQSAKRRRWQEMANRKRRERQQEQVRERNIERQLSQQPATAAPADAERLVGVVTGAPAANMATITTEGRIYHFRGSFAPGKAVRLEVGDEVAFAVRPAAPPPHISKRQRPLYAPGGKRFREIAVDVQLTGRVGRFNKNGEPTSERARRPRGGPSKYSQYEHAFQRPAHGPGFGGRR